MTSHSYNPRPTKRKRETGREKAPVCGRYGEERTERFRDSARVCLIATERGRNVDRERKERERESACWCLSLRVCVPGRERGEREIGREKTQEGLLQKSTRNVIDYLPDKENPYACSWMDSRLH